MNAFNGLDWSRSFVRRGRQGLSHPSVTTQKSGSTSAPADAQSKHLPHACSMLAACLQLVAHTNKSSEHLLLVELQRCHGFPGWRQAGHTGCRSEGCFWARYWYRQALHRVQCRGPRCLRRGERLIVLHRLHVAEVSSLLFHCFVFLTVTRSVDRDRPKRDQISLSETLRFMCGSGLGL